MYSIILALVSLAIGFGLGRVKSKATVTKVENTLDTLGSDIKKKL
jgi:hypothetical protein